METFDLGCSLVGGLYADYVPSLLRLMTELSITSASEDLGYVYDAVESILDNDTYPKTLWKTRLRVEAQEKERVKRGRARKKDPLPEFVSIGFDGEDEIVAGELSLNYVSALSLRDTELDRHDVSPALDIDDTLSSLPDRIAASVLFDGVFLSPTMLSEQLPDLKGLSESAFIFSSGNVNSTLSVWRDVVDMYTFCSRGKEGA